eukprot:gene17981-21417_t
MFEWENSFRSEQEVVGANQGAGRLPESSKAHAWICRVLVLMMETTDAARPTVINSTCTLVINNGLQIHLQSQENQRWGLKALALITDTYMDHIVTPIEDIKIYVMSMGAHPNERVIQLLGLMLLCNLAANHETRKSMIAVGVVDTISKVMNKCLEDVDIQQKVLEHGGMRTLLNAMYEHKPNEQVQQHGCKALAALNARDGGVHGMTKIKKASAWGAAQRAVKAQTNAVVQAMQLHGESHEV